MDKLDRRRALKWFGLGVPGLLAVSASPSRGCPQKTSSDEVHQASHGAILNHRVFAEGRGNARYLAVAFSPDGSQVVTAEQDPDFLAGVDMESVLRAEGPFLVKKYGRGPSLTLWDATTGRPIRPPMEYPARLSGVAFNSDGSRLVAAGGYKFDPGPRDVLQKIRDAAKRGHAIYSGGGFWAGDDGGAVRIWDVTKDREWIMLAPRAAAIDAVTWGTRFIAAIDRSYVLTLWAIGRLEPSLTIDNIKGEGQGPGLYWRTSNFAFSASGFRAVALSSDRRDLGIEPGHRKNVLKLYDATRGRGREFEASPDGGSVHSVALDGRGHQLATGDHEGKITLWDFDRCQSIRECGPPTGRGAEFLAFDPQGSRIACGAGDGTVSVWDVASGRMIRAFDGPRGDIRAIAFLKGALRVATVSPSSPAGEAGKKAPPGGPEQLKVWDAALD